MDIALIRHPEPQGAAGLCYGSSDIALPPDRSPDAAALHAKLARLGLAAPARLVSSPLQRCARMARALAGAAAAPGYPAPEFAEALRERHFGN
ncbi:MAG: histidine phosphatase family protein [Candidatus Protistobacter heckmanni]|nr:histidine phosphatase family protein [Candidatus Protistobacter heckmanni]